MVKRFDELLENELKKIYRFFVQQERELYLEINTRLHVRKKYENFSMNQLKKELDELQTLSSYATSLSSYIYLNMTGMSKILKKFDKKFRLGFSFSKTFIVEKYQKKNSELLYIHQYKILDEVGACVEELKNELEYQYSYLKSIGDQEETSIDVISNDDKKDNLIQNNNNDENKDSIENKFKLLNTSISNMEAFYHSTAIVFDKWTRYIKSQEYKSHVYSVRSVSDLANKDIYSGDASVKSNKNEHYLSNQTYWNIRITLTQTFLMSICCTYIYPTIYYLLKSGAFEKGLFENKIKRGFLCGLLISMWHLGGLVNLFYSNYMMDKAFKLTMLSGNILMIVGNLFYILGINYTSIFIMTFSRFVIGFANNSAIHRRYLLYFIPKRKINKYLLFFKLFTLIGNGLGPLLSFLSLLYNNFMSSRIWNEYTLPPWIMIILFTILLFIIIFVYTEPLEPKFNVYAKGHAPSDTMQRADSFTLDDSLTIFETEKLNEINLKVSNFNDENQFNDTNLVSCTIKELIEAESETYGNVRKAFWVIAGYEFILNFTLLFYITFTPPYLYVNFFKGNVDFNQNTAQRIISILFFSSLILFVPSFCISFFIVSMRMDKIFYLRILTLIFLILELLTTAFVVKSDFPILYFISFVLTILIANVLDDQLIFFYTKIIPTNFKFLKLNGNTFIFAMRYCGSFFGSISSLIAQFSDNAGIERDYFGEPLMIGINVFGMMIQLAIIIFFFYNANNFSERPIRRLVYSKNTREILRTEL